MKILFIFSIFLALSYSSCKNDSTQTINNAETVTKAAPTPITKASSETKTIALPGISESVMQNLAIKCDYIDYIFYDLPISISQDNKEAIRSNLNFISREKPSTYSSACKPMGRKFYHVDGEIILEADVYLDKPNGCFFYVFIDNGKEVYAQNISMDGVNFYFNIFGQAGIK